MFNNSLEEEIDQESQFYWYNHSANLSVIYDQEGWSLESLLGTKISWLLLVTVDSLAVLLGLWCMRILYLSSSVSDRLAFSQCIALCVYVSICLVEELWLFMAGFQLSVFCYVDSSLKIASMTFLHGSESMIAISRCLDVVKALTMRRISHRKVFWYSFITVFIASILKTFEQLLWSTPVPGICNSGIKYYPGWDLVLFGIVSGVSYGYVILFVLTKCNFMRIRQRFSLASVAVTIAVHLFVDAAFAMTLILFTDAEKPTGYGSFILIIICGTLIPVAYVLISSKSRERAAKDYQNCVTCVSSVCQRKATPATVLVTTKVNVTHLQETGIVLRDVTCTSTKQQSLQCKVITAQVIESEADLPTHNLRLEADPEKSMKYIPAEQDSEFLPASKSSSSSPAAEGLVQDPHLSVTRRKSGSVSVLEKEPSIVATSGPPSPATKLNTYLNTSLPDIINMAGREFLI